jgi:hypothetical protein
MAGQQKIEAAFVEKRDLFCEPVNTDIEKSFKDGFFRVPIL